MERNRRPKKILNKFTAAIRRWPEIFPTATNVADHLLCVIGTGYGWVDGEIRYTLDGSNPDRWITIGCAIAKLKREQVAFLNMFYYGRKTTPTGKSVKAEILKVEKGTDKSIKKHIDTIKRSCELAEEPFIQGFEIYPLYEYSNICRIPDNITDDYKAFIIEFYESVLKFDKEECNAKYIAKVKETIDSWKI